jgi:hypothetical protein
MLQFLLEYEDIHLQISIQHEFVRIHHTKRLKMK